MEFEGLEASWQGISHAAWAGFVLSLVFCVVLVLTQRWHGHLSHDHHDGVQKFHTSKTPRIGGAAIAAAYAGLWFFVPAPLKEYWLLIGLAGTTALLAGLAEDFTRLVGVKWRLFATMISGVLFALLTGYSMAKVDLPGVDWLLSYPVIALLFTGFCVGGVANAVNIIDGFNGLASGTLLIMFATFAYVAWRVGDPLVFSLAVLFAALVLGFFVVNFPLGRIFLGDGGAYFGGYLLATLGVLLPSRNEEISAWAAILICAYPVIETLFSMRRKAKRTGHSVGQPDRVHFHMLAYRRYARRLFPKSGGFDARNPATSVLTWAIPVLTAVLAALSYDNTWLSAGFFFVTVLIYGQVYRVMSLNGSRRRI